MLRVADSGIGIAPEDQTKIFERFYRADKGRSREMGGAGLGIAIALWIVKQHHGSIGLDANCLLDSEGKGLCDWRGRPDNDFLDALMSGLGRIAFVHKKYADAERQ